MIRIPSFTVALLLAATAANTSTAQAQSADTARASNQKDLPLAAARTIDIDTDEGS